MLWIAPTERDADTETLEKRLWDAADQFRANSGLTSAQYSQPVLGLIFLRFAEVRFLGERTALEKHASRGRRGSRIDDPTAYQAKGILYLTPNARFDHLLRLPEGADVGKAVSEAMRDIEKYTEAWCSPAGYPSWASSPAASARPQRGERPFLFWGERR